MSKTLRLLNQIDKEEIPKAFAEIRKRVDDPVAARKVIDDIVNKTEVTNPAGKAMLSNFTTGMLLGEAAMDEIEKLPILSPEERAAELKRVSYSGLDDLRSSIEAERFNYPKLGNKIEVKPEYNPDFWGRSDRSGVLLNQPPDAPLNFLLGVNLHEYGHQYDDAMKMALYKLKHLQTLNMKDPEVAREYDKTKKALFSMQKMYPDIKGTIMDKDLPGFKATPYNFVQTVSDAIDGKDAPSELEKSLTKGHFFKRNYEFDNLMKALKGGMKTVKGVGVGMIPAAAAGAIAAYSPDSMAGETAKTATKIMNEGDPLSMLTPENVNQNEEIEVQRMIQEQKAKQAPGSTDNKWYGRRWSKVKDLLGK